MRCNDTKIIDKNNDSDGNNTHSCLRTKRLWRLLESLTVPASLTKYVKGVGKAYNQMNGGSANGDAFVD